MNAEHTFDALHDLELALGQEGLADLLEWNAQIGDARLILEELTTSTALRELKKLAATVGRVATMKLISTDPTQAGRIAQLQALATLPDLFDKLVRATCDRLNAALDNVAATLDSID